MIHQRLVEEFLIDGIKNRKFYYLFNNDLDVFCMCEPKNKKKLLDFLGQRRKDNATHKKEQK